MTVYFTRIDGGLPAPTPRAVAIGNFDGVHRGHQAVLAEARASAQASGLALAVLTFDPHPAVALGRQPPPLLTALDRKAELLRRASVDEVLVRAFDAAFAAYTPERFVTEVLVAGLRSGAVIVGQNFRFGHNRAGDRSTLEALGREHGFEVRCFSLRGDNRGPFSSTRIRQAILRGDVAEASTILGRPHAFSGVVGRGDQRGRTIGFPTANVEEVQEVVPAIGVYAVVVDVLDADGMARALGAGVMNVGTRPTIDPSSPRQTQEVHLFDLDRDLYGQRLRVHVLERLRAELKFASLEELRAQIEWDAARGRELTAAVHPGPSGAYG
ncbi:MAG TPA: bifunctional riboflavin kinase/FAD synthetase [Polyangiaceae bacterium]|nr:bifunctional riboflavin kinase/FAD synthetase [Polyangiaceae bacterium]